MQPDTLIVHCSDSPFGCVKLIDDWHAERNFARDPQFVRPGEPAHIGYHRVITNGRLYSSAVYDPAEDGRVYLARHDDEEGAHAQGLNGRSLGVCLVGKNGNYTTRQLVALYGELLGLALRFFIPTDRIIGHKETPFEKARGAGAKTCPDLNMDAIRARIDRLRTAFILEFQAEKVEQAL